MFIGVTSGYAFGDIAGHVFGPGAGQPALNPDGSTTARSPDGTRELNSHGPPARHA